MTNFVTCSTIVKGPNTGRTFENNPINLDLCLTFYKSHSTETDQSGASDILPVIVFETGDPGIEPPKWVFNTEDERDARFEDLCVEGAEAI